MSQFYVEMKGGANANASTVGRRAHKGYGAYALAASYSGAIRVTPYEKDGVDCVRVTRENWKGSNGVNVVLYDGPFDVNGPYSTDLR